MKPKNTNEKQVEIALDTYFKNANLARPSVSLQKNLYKKLEISTSPSLFSGRFAMTGVAVVAFAVFFTTQLYQNQQQDKLMRAQQELNVAMHYLNKMTFKSLSSVKSNGIQPAVIKPMAKSLASI